MIRNSEEFLAWENVPKDGMCPEWRYDGMGQEQILVVERPFLTAFLFSLDPDRFLYILYNTFRFCL